jgi:hypothetical protein
VLLPRLSGANIEYLNHLHRVALALGLLPVGEEVERALTVTEPVLTTRERRIHLAGDILEVLLNLQKWHVDLATSIGRQA